MILVKIADNSPVKPGDAISLSNRRSTDDNSIIVEEIIEPCPEHPEGLIVFFRSENDELLGYRPDRIGAQFVGDNNVR